MKQPDYSRKKIYADEGASGWHQTEALLKEYVYADDTQWRRFLNLLLPALGVSFAVSGVIFFFAYNWTDLHKLGKLGIIEAMIVTAVALVLFTRWKRPVKQIILTGAAFLVGALFAVYGQIYQTGANAYDFFLAWTVFVTLWAIVSGYPPLWLVWIGLVNITIHLYGKQVSITNEWIEVLLNNSYTLICALSVIIAEGLYTWGHARQRTAWFINIVALAAFASATMNAITDIFETNAKVAIALPIALILFAAGLLFGYCKRQLFYIATVLSCVLLLIEAQIVQSMESENAVSIIFIMALTMMGGTTALSYLIIKLRKQWHETTTK